MSVFYEKCIIFLKEKDEPDLGGCHTGPNSRQAFETVVL